MKCKHCDKMWSLAHYNSIPYNCPYCGGELNIGYESVKPEASVADFVVMLVRNYGEDILKNRTLFLALMGDLAPHLKKERKIFSTAMTSDVMNLIEKCPENEQTKRIGRIRSMLDVLSEDAISLFINSIGQGVGWNIQQASPTEETVEQKAQRGDKEAIMEMLQQCSDADNMQGVFMWAQRGANASCEKCAYILGICYDKGHGTVENMQESRRWLQFAAEHGSMEASSYLGRKLLMADKVNEAEKWMKIAAESGDANAMYYLSNIYHQQNKERDALLWAKKSADAGELESYLLFAALSSELGTQEGTGEAVLYCSEFLKRAPKTHYTYREAERLMRQIVSEYKQKYIDKEDEPELVHVPPKPVPQPSIPKGKALEAVLRGYYDEFKINPTAYFMNSFEYQINPDYRKKVDKKLKNAVKSYAQGADKEQIYMFVDDTVFGGAKEGFMLTDIHLYGKRFGESAITPISIDSITDITVEKMNSSINIYVHYVHPNTTHVFKIFLIYIGDLKYQENLPKAEKMVSMLKKFVMKSQEYKRKTEFLSGEDDKKANIWHSIQPYVEKLYGNNGDMCFVYSKKSNHYYNNESYRIITDDLLREGMNKLTKAQQFLLSDEQILLFTSMDNAGFILTEESFFTPNGTIDASIITSFEISEGRFLSGLYAYYKTSDGKQQSLLLLVVLPSDLDGLKKIKEMLDTFLKAKKLA